MKLEEILARLQEATAVLAPMRGQMPEEVSSETAFALGEILGATQRAKESIKRDIRCQSLSVSNAKPSTTPKRTES
jgi:hypothetical protein